MERAISYGTVAIIADYNLSLEIEKNQINLPILYVNNIKKSLSLLVQKNLQGKLTMAITGSTGKTTTTGNLAMVLSKKNDKQKFIVHTNFRNYNTSEGIECSICSAKENTQIHLYEIGIDGPHQMREKMEAIGFFPYIAICLPIKYSHSANFPTMEDLVREKLLIASSHLTKYFIFPKIYYPLVKDFAHLKESKFLEDFYPLGYNSDNPFENLKFYELFIENIATYCENIYAREFI